MNKSGSKRKADSSEIAVPAKRSANVLVPEEVLRTMAASLNAATLALMDLPCGDVAARGCAVAVIADCKRQMNDLLGIQRRVSENCRHNYLDRERPCLSFIFSLK